MKTMKILAVTLLGLLAASCDSDRTSTGPTPTSSSSGQVAVSINLGPVGVLARTLQMTPTRLLLRFSSRTSTILLDTISISGSGTVLKSYSFDAGFDTLYVEGRDQRDSVLYTGSTVFQVQAAATTSVNLSLSARYSSLRVRFPIVDSLYRYTLSVDGANWADSSVAQGTRRGDTVRALHDYLSASTPGTSHQFSLKAWGRYQGKDTVLYSLDTALSIVSGSNMGRSLVLRWVGPSRPGQASLSVAVGSVGQVELLVGYGNGTDTAVAVPVFSLPGGTYTSAVSVSITSATPGASIYFTTNGSVPSTASARDTGLILVSSTTTIRAIAVKGSTASSIASVTYSIGSLAGLWITAPDTAVADTAIVHAVSGATTYAGKSSSASVVLTGDPDTAWKFSWNVVVDALHDGAYGTVAGLIVPTSRDWTPRDLSNCTTIEFQIRGLTSGVGAMALMVGSDSYPADATNAGAMLTSSNFNLTTSWQKISIKVSSLVMPSWYTETAYVTWNDTTGGSGYSVGRSLKYFNIQPQNMIKWGVTGTTGTLTSNASGSFEIRDIHIY